MFAQQEVHQIATMMACHLSTTSDPLSLFVIEQFGKLECKHGFKIIVVLNIKLGFKSANTTISAYLFLIAIFIIGRWFIFVTKGYHLLLDENGTDKESQKLSLEEG